MNKPDNITSLQELTLELVDELYADYKKHGIRGMRWGVRRSKKNEEIEKREDDGIVKDI